MRTVAVAFYDTPWFRAVVAIVAAIIAARIVDWLLARRDSAMTKLLGKEPGRADRTRYVMIRRLAEVSILFVGIAIALSQFQVVGTLARAMLASVAIVAAIIGIAARTPIANLVSGIMIAFSQPVRLGDYISVDDVYGTVEAIGLTYTYIRTLDDRRVVIPNEAFASKVVHNYSMGAPGSMVAVTFSVPLETDVEAVRRAVLDVAQALAPAPEGIAATVDVEGLEADHVTLRINAWTSEPLQRRRLASDLRAAVLRRLLEDGLVARPPGERP